MRLIVGGKAGRVGKLRLSDGSCGNGGSVGNGIPMLRVGGKAGNVGKLRLKVGSDISGNLKLQLLI